MNAPVINHERLARVFMELVRIDSISKEEGRVGRFLLEQLNQLGLETYVDQAHVAIGAEMGNIIAKFKGNCNVAPLVLSAHMDTVEPGRNIRPKFENGVFSSSGDTVLGSDDKSAVAIILEVLRCIRELGLPCGPCEIVFSICEEIGLLGAKHLAYDKLDARMGFALDTGKTDVIVNRAPAMNSLTFRVHGKAAHAGSSPENGINAISLASKAIAQLELGRIDHETTCNIGCIEGGLATNIVPSEVLVKGEVRSHDPGKLQRLTDAMVSVFENVTKGYQRQTGNGAPKLDVEIKHDFDRLFIDPAHSIITLAQTAAASLGRSLALTASGGGSDANIMSSHGLLIPVLGTGMANVHTVNETIRLDDMVAAATLVLEILRLHAEG